jgi:hypothetical protein
MGNNFKIASSGLLVALIVGGLGLISNLVPSEKMLWLIGAVATVVFCGGIVAYGLQTTAVKEANEHLKQLADKCDATLAQIQSAHVSAILNNSVVSDAELDRLERSPDTKEVWIIAPGNLDYDIPGKVFFNTLKFNVDTRGIHYTYIIKDCDEVQYNIREIYSKIEKRDNILFVFCDDVEWDHLPIVGVPVTIHNPNSTEEGLRIYLATQDDNDRGSYWSVFRGWTVKWIIGRTRSIVVHSTMKKSIEQIVSASAH